MNDEILQQLLEQIKKLEKRISELEDKTPLHMMHEPLYGSNYYYITDLGNVHGDKWFYTGEDEERFKYNNCFQTEDAAYESLKRRNS